MKFSFRAMEHSVHGVQSLAALFAANDDPRPEPQFVWRYLDNPAGRCMVEMADAESVAGAYAVSPVQLRVDGAVTLAAQSLDTLVDSAYRGQGLFTKLASALYARIENEDGVRGVFGFPNGNSAPGFFGKLEWTNLDPVPFLVRPLRLDSVTSRIFPRAPSWIRRIGLPVGSPRTAAEISDLPADTNELWASFSTSLRVGVNRDRTYLRWRLSDPRFQYRIVEVRNQGRLEALTIFRVADKHGTRLGYIMDVLHRPTNPHAGHASLNLALKAMKEDGASLALAWCFKHSPNFLSHARCGFVPLPERLRPIELHFGCRSSSPLLRQRSAWYLSYLDSDTV